MVLCRLLTALVSGTEPVWALSGWSASSPVSRRAVGELGEVYYAAGSPGVTPRHAAGIGGAARDSLASFCCFFCAESDSRNSCMKSGAELIFFSLLALNVLS